MFSFDKMRLTTLGAIPFWNIKSLQDIGTSPTIEARKLRLLSRAGTTGRQHRIAPAPVV